MCRENKLDSKLDTKQRIAAALRQLMQERPLRKITVQDLMERTQMKRQSFYYHFQDIRDVLVWICTQQLMLPMQARTDLCFEDWLMAALRILSEDRGFYRRVMAFADPPILTAFCAELVQPRIAQLLFPGQDPSRLSDRQRFAVDFGTQALASQVQNFLNSRSDPDEEEIRARLRFLLNTLHLDGTRPPQAE